MYRSKAERNIMKRRLKRANRIAPEAWTMEGVSKGHFRKWTFVPTTDRDDKLPALRAEHLKLDMLDLDQAKIEEENRQAEIEYYDEMERLDRQYYDNDCDDDDGYLDYLMDEMMSQEDECWSVYHEFLSVDAHNSQLREVHWDKLAG